MHPVSAVHSDAERVLRGWAAPDDQQAQLRDTYRTHLERYADATSRSCREGHLTASALVWQETRDGPRVLLTLHARIGRWLQMGGHIEPTDETLAGAALREGTEESGIGDLVLHPHPLALDRHTVICRDGGRTGSLDHLDVQFLALARPDAVASKSAESADLAWYPVTAEGVVDCDVDASVQRLVRVAWALLTTS